MNSFALWTSLKEDNKQPSPASSHKKDTENCPESDNNAVSADLHINLWVEYAKKCTPFLDIGIMIRCPNQVEKLYFFVPFHIEKEQVSDLGEVLTDNQILNAVFNENYSLRTRPTSKHAEVFTESGREMEFDLYSLDINYDIQFENNYNGTILIFSFENINQGIIKHKNNKCYFRFRIKSENLNQLTRRYKINTIDKLVNNVFTVTQIIDFRYNNNRSLHRSLIEEMHSRNNICLSLKAIHFLLLTDAKIDILQTNYTSARDLEKHIWQKYINEKEINDIIAYHWSKKDRENKSFNSWELFTKIRIRKCNAGTIAIYLCFLALFTIVVNIISNFLWIYLSKLL